MRLICYLLAIVLLIVAVVYFVIPADQLPSFMPGYQAGVMRVHMKHAALSGGLAIVLFIVGWLVGRRG